jgi:hypothetical protein
MVDDKDLKKVGEFMRKYDTSSDVGKQGSSKVRISTSWPGKLAPLSQLQYNDYDGTHTFVQRCCSLYPQ